MKVRLKWLDGSNRCHVEEVHLISEQGALYTPDGQPLTVTVTELIDLTGWVLFEDEEGIFGVPPNRVIEMVPISN